MERSILLIDDNIQWHQVLKDILKEVNSDIELHATDNGKDGLSKYKELCNNNHEPSLVLVDIRLGDMDGRDLAKQLKAFNNDVNQCFFTFFMEDVIGKNLGIPLISKQQEPIPLIKSIKRAIRGEHIV